MRDAANYYHQASTSGDALDDYADYLAAQAAIQAGHPADAYALLDSFAERHPDSIFVATAPVLLANAHMAQGDARGRVACAAAAATDTPGGAAPRFPLCAGPGLPAVGRYGACSRALPRHLPERSRLSYEATQAAAQLAGDGHAADRGGAQDPRRPAVQRQALWRGERGVQRDRQEQSAARARRTATRWRSTPRCATSS